MSQKEKREKEISDLIDFLERNGIKYFAKRRFVAIPGKLVFLGATDFFDSLSALKLRLTNGDILTVRHVVDWHFDIWGDTLFNKHKTT